MERYWAYNNWTVIQGGRARVHRAMCRYCNNGQGIHRTGPTRNGRWWGPYNTRQDAFNDRRFRAAMVVGCLRCQPQES